LSELVPVEVVDEVPEEVEPEEVEPEEVEPEEVDPEEVEPEEVDPEEVDPEEVEPEEVEPEEDVEVPSLCVGLQQRNLGSNPFTQDPRFSLK